MTDLDYSTLDPGIRRTASDERIYPCVDCGLMRSQAEGGTTFTVCDTCWDKHYKKPMLPPGVGEP